MTLCRVFKSAWPPEMECSHANTAVIDILIGVIFDSPRSGARVKVQTCHLVNTRQHRKGPDLR